MSTPSVPPTTIIYYVPTSYETRDWRGSDIAFITVLGVLLLVILTCSLAECYYTPVRHIQPPCDADESYGPYTPQQASGRRRYGGGPGHMDV